MGFLDFIFYTFIVVVFFQAVFYIFFFGRFAFLKEKGNSSKNIAISVIVCAKNEAENLKTFLPSIIDQDYPNFEIVLINDASNDNTLKVMKRFEKQHQNIKIVDVKSIEAFWGNKKYALTLGIKASTHDYLLFTDADCKPLSKNWIKEMTSYFDNEKTVVLGYGGYSKIKKSFLNKLIRFETLITAVYYFSFAKIGMPYMGVGRNLAYTKKEFFNANGFINHIKVRSGDDDLFINQVANNKNTSICFSKESFTESIPKQTFKEWFKQKRRHVSTAIHYKKQHKILLALIYSLQLLFWLLSIILLVSTYKWLIVCSLFLFRIILQYIILGASSKKLEEKDLLALLPFLEIFLIITQLTIFINNLISKPNYWK
ncbi:Glycosyltransferase, catalytic subunit of cellulose synthase and poly-beta-1,6-N-acetylglucosamine synthase [Flaviramulus basaltis]|uniref:Glycosyltransferase, catalytic subunit of cellulose synthase and poly-beta-1,6-N-acetylglucosamine synthase n=1 Tax=Flaviramulus basaltis TaxID=369401 RepID=A0A1K2IMY9_9FLAO|nr:glycosyltransferase [Flaviramulus basaltis]SFZ93828.1 Glycosyltransferase, catalytic subunit of cellulose synthase and poly-beta-1,6-N-acetylglucosamine synthase [Flaviramulus basaltis]